LENKLKDHNLEISKKPKFAVVLTKEAIGLLKDENIS
jgi:hypothetical protein